MNEETLQRIDALAAKLGVVGEHLWAVLIKQAYISGFFWAIAAVVVGLVAMAFLLAAVRSEGGPDDWAPTLAAGLFASAFGLAMAYEAVTRLANPEFWALMQVLP